MEDDMKKHIGYALSVITVLIFAAACNDSGTGSVTLDDTNTGNYDITLSVADVAGVEKAGTAYASRKKANKGQSVTLTVIPPEGVITEDGNSDGGGGGEAAEPVYYFVKALKGTFSKEGGPKTTGVTFSPSPSKTNEWTFNMPDGDLTVDITFTHEADPNTAYLQWLILSAGTMSPEFAKDILAYTVTLPYGTEQFSISAQSENPYIKPVLTKTGYTGELPEDSLFDVNLIFTPPEGEEVAGAPGYCISEGANDYVITVTSQNGEEKEYTIKVILLPDLSLSSLRVSKVDEFDIELAPLDNQTVYVQAEEGVTVSAQPAGEDVSVTVNPSGAISGITAGRSTPVTVTVRKEVSGVTAAPQKVYKLDLRYGVNPIAEGGLLSFIPVEGDSGSYYEVHKFTSNTEGGGSQSLSFYDTTMASITADILVVGGGGGAGGDYFKTATDFPGGGGAGGLLYKTGYSLTLQDGSVPVVVGAGGAGGKSDNVGTYTDTIEAEAGENGGDSWIGTDDSNKLTAPGGGGGGCGGATTAENVNKLNGKSGGSGGGGGSGGNTGSSFGAGGSGTGGGSNILGKTGGSGSGGNSKDSGGGGGGAGSAGGNGVVAGTPGAGGAGWIPGNNGTQWISDVTGVNEFSHGGNGGGYENYINVQGTDGVNFGDGGSGGNNGKSYGASGQRGIVIIRFLHPSTAD
jgi:hypothetical protein